MIHDELLALRGQSGTPFYSRIVSFLTVVCHLRIGSYLRIVGARERLDLRIGRSPSP